MLEAAQYTDNAFVTLTYAPEHEPALRSLNPEHTRNWLKRLRFTLAPHRFRFYLVGEYGEKSQRPHYHAALFNVPTCTRVGDVHRPPAHKCCDPCKLVQNSWPWGHVFLGSLETDSAQYVAGYVTKKMTAKDDPRLNGRHPEFSRQSNKNGGLGYAAMHELASQILALNLDTSQGDVPSSLRHGSRQLPLGRYLRRKLRLMIGKEENAPPEARAKIAASLLLLLENYEGAPYHPHTAGLNLTKRITQASAQKALQIEGRMKIHKKKGDL